MGFALKKPKDVPGKSWPAVSSQLPTILLNKAHLKQIIIGFFVAFGGVLVSNNSKFPSEEAIANSLLTYSLAMTPVLFLASLP
jgi:hypothetical protein